MSGWLGLVFGFIGPEALGFSVQNSIYVYRLDFFFFFVAVVLCLTAPPSLFDFRKC